jgi:hypothetical protein
MDRLEPANGRAVERQPVIDDVGVERGCRCGEVLHDARKVAEPKVDILDVFVSNEVDKFSGMFKRHFRSSLLAVRQKAPLGMRRRGAIRGQ